MREVLIDTFHNEAEYRFNATTKLVIISEFCKSKVIVGEGEGLSIVKGAD